MISNNVLLIKGVSQKGSRKITILPVQNECFLKVKSIFFLGTMIFYDDQKSVGDVDTPMVYQLEQRSSVLKVPGYIPVREAKTRSESCAS